MYTSERRVRKGRRKRKVRKAKDGRVIAMEATLAVLIGGTDTEKATLAPCKFRLEIDGL